MRRVVRWSCGSLALTALLCLPACATTSAKMDLVRQRAVFDMDCDSLDIVDLRGNTYGVSGCGRRSTYVVTCGEEGSYISDCQAVANSENTR